MTAIKPSATQLEAQGEGLTSALQLLRAGEHARIETIQSQPVAILGESVRVESLRPILDSYLPTPDRARGFDEVHDEASFVALVNRQKAAHSVVFAHAQRGAVALKAVFDYHGELTAGRDGTPRHCEHGVRFPVELSEEWLAWQQFAAKGFVDTTTFAEFLEERIVDVLQAPSESPALAALQELLGGLWATPLKLIELSRGLQVNVAEVVKNATSLSSGEIQLTYDSTHRDGAGQPLRVPSLFAIGIPVFRGGVRYQIAVRLRYRVRNGAISWAIAPHRWDATWQDAVDELVRSVQEKTSLPVFMGKLGG
jgi:hypothetical protein